jgi:hypothetical protein
VLQQLEKDMVLVQVQSLEAFQVWVVEASEEKKDLERSVFGDA